MTAHGALSPSRRSVSNAATGWNLRLVRLASLRPRHVSRKTSVKGSSCCGSASKRTSGLTPMEKLPIPPYIGSAPEDPTRYQTVYAAVPGSAAAPTAGMHFTPELIDNLRRRGVDWAEVTLHVGLDTFRPVTAESVADHPIHQEWCEVPVATAEAIAACRGRGSRVIAVGTTVARTLETLGEQLARRRPGRFLRFYRYVHCARAPVEAC